MTCVKLIWVGKKASGPWAELCQEYATRISRFCQFSEARVRPAEGRDHDPARARSLEGERILDLVKDGDYLVVLDEHGRQRSSSELARLVSERGRTSAMVFVIGSDLGLDDAVTSRAREVLSLSKMTLPHQLARVLLVEQLYRTFDILSGGAYHRADVPPHGG